MTEAISDLKTSKIFDLISKGVFYVLAFLLPLFFLPWTANALEFNKQALLIGLVAIALFSWMIKVLILGKIKLNVSLVHIPIGVLFLVYVFSTVFSLWRYGSFWGQPLVVSEGLITIMALVLVYFLASNVLEKKNIFYLIVSLVLSVFLAMIYGVFQILGKFILAMDITKIASFNTIGTVNTLGLLGAVLLPLIITLVIRSKKFWKVIFVAALLFDALMIVLMNFSFCWWIVIAGSSLVIVLIMQKRDIFDSRWLILPMFFLAIALFFSFFRFQIVSVVQRPIEVFLTQKASFNIAWSTIKERPILGSGPGTFIYDFSKHKNVSFNENYFWNIRFERAGSKTTNILATTGILGFLSFLALIGITIFSGVKFLIRKSKLIAGGDNKTLKTAEGDGSFLLGAGVFLSFIALSITFFLYHSNLTLDFVFFLLIGSFVGLSCADKKEFILKPSSLLTLCVTFVFTLVFIFGLGIFILEGQRYAAEVNYLQGINAWAQEGQGDIALTKLEKAIMINPNTDVYLRDLSQAYLQRINFEAQRQDIPAEEINQRIQILINNSVNYAKAAVDINPQNVANWSVRGFIYQNLIGVVQGVEDWAVKSYDEALTLEPSNPYFPTQGGIILLRKSLLLPEDKAEEKAKIIGEAQIKFEKAIELKSDYAPARFQLAMVYQAQGKTDESIEQLEATKTIAPFDTGLGFQLGLAYYQSESYELAKSEFERVVGIDPNYANALYFLGLTYHKLGYNEQAIEKFVKIEELNPDNKEIKMVLENLRNERPPLEGVIEQHPPIVPIEKTPEELEEKENQG